MKIPLALSLLFLAAASEAKVYERCEFAKELVEDQVGWDFGWDRLPISQFHCIFSSRDTLTDNFSSFVSGLRP